VEQALVIIGIKIMNLIVEEIQEAMEGLEKPIRYLIQAAL